MTNLTAVSDRPPVDGITAENQRESASEDAAETVPRRVPRLADDVARRPDYAAGGSGIGVSEKATNSRASSAADTSSQRPPASAFARPGPSL